MTELTGLRCSQCGRSLPLGHKEVCPLCGSPRQVHEMTLTATANARASMAWSTTREYYERHPVLLAIVVIITLGSPFLGLYVAGLPGVFAGLGFSVLGFLLGLKAITKIRHTRQGDAP